MLRTTAILALCAALMLAACAHDDRPPTPPEGPPTNGSNATLVPVMGEYTDASDEQLAAVVDAENRFAFDLYGELGEQEGNLFYSPFSIATALGMTMEGAVGETYEEMRTTLHFGEDVEDRRAGIATLHEQLLTENDAYEINVANAIWPDDDFPMSEEFASVITGVYGGGAKMLDYSAPEPARVEINEWVELQTEELIEDLIPAGAIDPLTKMVLTNAIYFKGTWVQEFDEDETRDEPFLLADGSEVEAPLMRLTGEDATFNYAEDATWQVLELPYEGDRLSMLVFLPKERGSLRDVDAGLDLGTYQSLTGELVERQIDTYLPKFEMEWGAKSIKEQLIDLGMQKPFMDADFSGMGDGGEELSITDVLHKAYVKVDEEGTEAAAATAVVVGIESLQPPKLIFLADHPFLFVIRDAQTGSILFMGRVMDPTA